MTHVLCSLYHPTDPAQMSRTRCLVDTVVTGVSSGTGANGAARTATFRFALAADEPVGLSVPEREYCAGRRSGLDYSESAIDCILQAVVAQSA